MPVLNTPKYGGNIASLLPAPLPTTPQPAPVPFNTYDLNNPMSLMSVSPTFQQPGIFAVDPSFAPAFQPRIGDTGTSFGPSTGIAPGFQPTLDREELATGVEAEKKRLKGERNKKLGFMLYALGGALRGDKDFVQNTMALQAMKEGKEKQEAQEKALNDFLKKNKDKLNPTIVDLAKAIGGEKGAQLVIGSLADPKDRPADIQKLERFGKLKSKLDPSSPNYDPTYTLEQFNQDASILGVTSKALEMTKKQYIDEYMKQQKTLISATTGRRLYTDEELRKMAEESYNSVYGTNETPTPPPPVNNEGEEIVDLGSI